jgi:hypothetical protein
VQCQLRGLEPGPINTFPGWQALGRNVKRGERALTLCMPIIRKVRDEQTHFSDGENGEHRFTSFMHKARWFAISQTTGDKFTPPRLPEWEAEPALAALDIEWIAFTDTDGNCQGYTRLSCRQHNRAYVAKSVMWRSAFIASSQQQTSEPNAT